MGNARPGEHDIWKSSFYLLLRKPSVSWDGTDDHFEGAWSEGRRGGGGVGQFSEA